MKNVKELREHLSTVFTDLQGGSLDHKVAASLANIAGKMISSAKVQLDYHIARKEKRKITFLHSMDK